MHHHTLNTNTLNTNTFSRSLPRNSSVLLTLSVPCACSLFAHTLFNRSHAAARIALSTHALMHARPLLARTCAHARLSIRELLELAACTQRTRARKINSQRFGLLIGRERPRTAKPPRLAATRRPQNPATRRVKNTASGTRRCARCSRCRWWHSLEPNGLVSVQTREVRVTGPHNLPALLNVPNTPQAPGCQPPAASGEEFLWPNWTRGSDGA